MKENFVICIESLHVGDTGSQSNVSLYFVRRFVHRNALEFIVLLYMRIVCAIVCMHISPQRDIFLVKIFRNILCNENVKVCFVFNIFNETAYNYIFIYNKM